MTRERLTHLRPTAWGILGLAFEAAPIAASLTILFIPLGAAGIAFTALTQRWVIDVASRSPFAVVVAATLLTGIGFAVRTTVTRLQSNLEFDITTLVSRSLRARALTLVSNRSRFDAIYSSSYNDAAQIAVRDSRALASLGWAFLASGAQVIAASMTSVILATIHPIFLTLGVAVWAPLAATWVGQRATARARNATAAWSRLEEAIHSIYTRPDSVRETVLNGFGSTLESAADEASATVRRAMNRSAAVSVVAAVAAWFIYSAILVTCLAVFTTSRSVTAGDVVAALALALGLKFQISLIVNLWSAALKGRSAASGYNALLSASAEATDAPDLFDLTEQSNGIRMLHVDYSYPDGTRALKDVSLIIPAGTLVALVGPNGAGKSTLVDVALGLVSPTGGEMAETGIPHMANNTALVQHPLRLAGSIAENIAIGDVRADAGAEAVAADRAGLAPILEAHPDGLHAQLEPISGGRRLSGGEWQRVALARALMRRKFLRAAFDEPTAALDAESEVFMVDRVEEASRSAAAARGGVSFLVTHRASVAARADLVVVMDDGRVVEQGTPAELIGQGGQFADLWEAARQRHT